MTKTHKRYGYFYIFGLLSSLLLVAFSPRSCVDVLQNFGSGTVRTIQQNNYDACVENYLKTSQCHASKEHTKSDCNELVFKNCGKNPGKDN